MRASVSISLALGVVMSFGAPDGARGSEVLQRATVMFDAPAGTPVAVGTIIGGDENGIYAISSTDLLDRPRACMRIASRGACHPVDLNQSHDLGNPPTLGVLFASIPYNAEGFNEIRMAPGSGLEADRLAGIDPEIVGRSSLAEWRVPLGELHITSVLEDGFLLSGGRFTQLDIGAPVGHDNLGLLGVIAAVDESTGAARVIDIFVLLSHLKPRKSLSTRNSRQLI